MARRARWYVPSSIAIAIAAAGCGPIVYVSQNHDASDAIDAAREANAEQYAPYWWTRAVQYLEKAREIAAYADFQGANKFNKLAAEAATKATEDAQAAAKDPSKRPINVNPSPDVAPAKLDPQLAPAKIAPAQLAPAKDAP